MNDPLDPAFDPYKYRAKLTHIVDGDTYDFEVDLGFRTTKEIRVRPLDVDTAETWFVSHDSEEYERGVIHTEFVEEWFEEAREEYDGKWPFVVDTKKDETGKYGRWLAYIYRKSDGEEVTEALIEEFGEEVVY